MAENPQQIQPSEPSTHLVELPPSPRLGETAVESTDPSDSLPDTEPDTEPNSNQDVGIRRPPGRPKGSKNKKGQALDRFIAG